MKHIDILMEDPTIKDQKWGLVSMVAPGNVNNKCDSRAIKFRGNFKSRGECEKYAKRLQNIDPDFNIYVIEVGKWIPFLDNPDQVNSIEKQEYAQTQLNDLISEYKRQREVANDEWFNRKQELIDEFKKHVICKTVYS
jgi:hypothetical protein